MHMSQIFQPRAWANDDDTETHIDMCKKVIGIYQQLIRSKNLTPQTMMFLFKLLLGATDFVLKTPILKSPVPKNANPNDVLLGHIADAVDKDLFSVTLECLMRHEIMDESLWAHFKVAYPLYLRSPTNPDRNSFQIGHTVLALFDTGPRRR